MTVLLNFKDIFLSIYRYRILSIQHFSSTLVVTSYKTERLFRVCASAYLHPLAQLNAKDADEMLVKCHIEQYQHWGEKKWLQLKTKTWKRLFMRNHEQSILHYRMITYNIWSFLVMWMHMWMEEESSTLWLYEEKTVFVNIWVWWHHSKPMGVVRTVCLWIY